VFVREEGPQFVAFLKAYFEYMEQSGNAVDAIRSLKDNQDIDRTIDSFVEYFRKEFMLNIPKDILADKRTLVKHIRDFLSHAWFSRILSFSIPCAVWLRN